MRKLIYIAVPPLPKKQIAFWEPYMTDERFNCLQIRGYGRAGPRLRKCNRRQVQSLVNTRLLPIF